MSFTLMTRDKSVLILVESLQTVFGAAKKASHSFTSGHTNSIWGSKTHLDPITLIHPTVHIEKNVEESGQIFRL